MRWKKPIKISASSDPSKAVPITLLLSPSDNEYITMIQSYVKDAAEKAGYRINILDSKNSSEIQLEQVKSARNTGEKAIIIDLVDPYDAKAIIDAAGNMKVVFLLRAPADMSLLNKNAVLVSSDEEIAGKLQGDFLSNYFKQRNKNSIKYILLKGPLNVAITQQRTDAALQALADNGIQATPAAEPIVANFQRNEAQYKIYPILASGVKFDTIISNNDAMALGAIDAMEALRMDPSKIPIVGVDATYSAFRALRDGNLAMTVFQNAKAQSETAVTAVTNMLNGNPINKGTSYSVSPNNPYVIYIPFEPVTMSNIPEDLEYTAPI